MTLSIPTGAVRNLPEEVAALRSEFSPWLEKFHLNEWIGTESVGSFFINCRIRNRFARAMLAPFLRVAAVVSGPVSEPELVLIRTLGVTDPALPSMEFLIQQFADIVNSGKKIIQIYAEIRHPGEQQRLSYEIFLPPMGQDRISLFVLKKEFIEQYGSIAHEFKGPARSFFRPS